MKISRRQALPFVAAVIMLVSAFTFAPASGETGFTVSASGFYDNYSFASHNGTATYTLSMENTGDSDINDVVITSLSVSAIKILLSPFNMSTVKS